MAAVLCIGAVSTVFSLGAAANDASGLDEIVVTAQRREESAQNVGIALSVLSGASLADKGITNVDDLQNALPSLQVEPAFGSGLPQYRIRGVGFLDYTSNNASPVGVSLDDVAYALPIQSQGQLFDIDRVEVLRGPQGTLYGRNTTGGEINFVTNRPTSDFHAGVTAEYGSHNEFLGEAFVSGTLAENLTARLSAATEQGGAWQHDRLSGASLGAKDKEAVRLQLQFEPAEAVNFRLSAHLAEDKSDETGLQLIAPYTPYNAGAGGAVIPTDTSRYVTGWRLSPLFAETIGINPNSKPGLNNLNEGVDLTGNIGLGAVKIVSISSYNKMIRREYGDWDATQYDDSDEYFRSNVDVISQELRFESVGSGPLSWVGGVLYTDQRLDENFYSDFSDADIFGAAVNPDIILTHYDQNATSFGEFGQVNYKFNDSFSALIGVREDHETRDIKNLNTGVVVGPPFPSFTGGAVGASTTSNLPSGKVELDYHPEADTLLYYSISRGVKSGGFTAHNTTSAGAISPFEPEKLLDYEVGIKSDVTHTLRINASAFYYHYLDEQILGKVAYLTGFIGRFVNANSRIAGGELEVQWQPLQGLSISQYAGYTVGYYESHVLNSSGIDYDGQPLSFPKWSYGGDASYGFDVGQFKITAETNYSFHDTYSQFYLLGSPVFTVPKYWLANANLSLSPAAGAPWEFTLWGRNIFNRSYDVTRNFFLPGTDIAQAGEPATFGVRVSYKY
jgi:outer membrane receptor protein involved in Fe transport